MVELKICNLQISNTVKNLLSLCSIPTSNKGIFVICDEKSASEINTQAKNGVIVIYSDRAYKESQIHSTLSEIYGSKYVCYSNPFPYAALIESIHRFASTEDEIHDTHPYSALIISPAQCTVSYSGNTVTLSPRETSLLVSLHRRLGTPVTREILKEEVWENETEEGTNIVDVYISYLRKKLRPILGEGCIISKRNMGYMLLLPRE